MASHTTRAGERHSAIESAWQQQDYDTASLEFERWLSTDPERAFEYLANLKPPMEAAHFAPEIRRYLETLHPSQAMEKTLGLGFDHRLQESVSADAFAQWLKENREASLAWLYEHGEHAFAESLAERAGRLGQLGEPEGALDQILLAGESPLNGKLIKGILLRWLHEDGDAAVEYINNSERSGGFDEALDVHAHQLLERNPALAMIWAEAIESESFRTMTISQIEQQWSEETEAEYQQLRLTAANAPPEN